jgi:hypothetical protein
MPLKVSKWCGGRGKREEGEEIDGSSAVKHILFLKSVSK